MRMHTTSHCYYVSMMAGGRGSGEDVSLLLRNLELDVTCSICYEQYRDPKLLPCAHYFCCRCVKRVAQHANGKPFPCPMCNETTTLPPQGVDELPAAHFVERLLDVHRALNEKKEALRGPRKMTCDVCQGEGVTNFCKDCDQFLCSDCSGKHGTTALYSGHQLMSLDELKSSRGRGRNNARYAGVHMNGGVDGKGKEYAMCTKHNDPIKVYCHDHDMLICRDCMLYDHPNDKCRTGFIKDLAPKTRQALNDALVPILSARESVIAAERDVEAVQERVCAQQVEQLEEVHGIFDEIRARIDHCEQTLLDRIEAVSQGKKDTLAGQRKALQISTEEVEATIDTVKNDVANLSDDEIMSTHRQIEMKMQKELARHRHRTLEPAKNADLICTVPSPDDTPIKMGLAYPREDLRHLRIALPDPVFVGSKADYKIHVPYSIGEEVKIEIQSLVDPGCVLQALVTPWKDKEVVLRGVVVARYDVTFTPRVRGPHRLTTKINGLELPGSPFTIFAKIDPRHLGYVIRQSGDAGRPYGIAMTPEGLLVTAANGTKNLSFWSRDLKEVGNPIVSPMFHFPRGVAVGRDGAIYSSDKGVEKSRDYTILKFVNGTLQRGATFGSRNVRLIKIIRDQLFCADERNSQIHRFSLDRLDHIGTFNTTKAADTHDMAEYNNQLYVVGSTQIAIYSFDWKFVDHVPLKAPTPSIMRGICFGKSGNMFVSQAGQGVQGVYVYSATGDFVTSFGHHMEHPCGIVIDSEGFVYVCDHKPKQKRIYVF